MNSFRHHPLGAPYPDTVHCVICSLPTMDDIHGYEEKRPGTMAAIHNGYPRFVEHQYVQRVSHALDGEKTMAGRKLIPLASMKAAETLRNHIGAQVRINAVEDFATVDIPAGGDTEDAVTTFLKHTGLRLGSRHAEDYLLKHDLLEIPQKEKRCKEDPAGKVRGKLASVYASDADNVHLAISGMNAFYAAYRAINAIQSARGRDIWIQLGWLYINTGKIIEEFGNGEYAVIYDVFDMEALREVFDKLGGRIAGIITECPTNPLMQTTDLPAVAELARKHGAALVVDPTMATPANIDTLAHADIAVNSLTKYFCTEADVMSGAAILNTESPFYDQLRESLPQLLEPPYPGDVARLAAQIDGFDSLVARTNASTPIVAEFLESHPAVKQCYWAEQPRTRENYNKIRRQGGGPGSIITFELHQDMAGFYDRLPMVKGPSFGASFTMLCPYLYLAHYDLVTTPEGRQLLARAGLVPDLLRLSVGTEPVEAIIDTLKQALPTE